ncbi:relaxase [Streptococcus pneumoniae]|nr:relaxase [Streptococcus pneumoniae]CIS79788.1 relaxase [Streptococcus pneumoniae]CIU92922.1 relaxase [Streptococcus pneumoniae]CJL67210.1 relaxase [Streptococcus pneumoniae]COL24643.1 relaxase [Streptococcus pneumoniae]
MIKPIRGRQLSKRDLYDEDFFKTYFAKQEIESRLKFLLKSVYSLEELHVKAKELNLTIELKQKNVMFTLEEDGKKISLSHKKISEKNLYDVQFFNRYFEDREVRDIQALENLQEDFQTFREEQHKEKVSAEEIEEAFETFKKKRDTVREFEVELAENQIEKLVDKGVYIKVSFGVKQSGLIFIPNYQLDIFEEDNHKKYKVYIRETSSYFVYNKENRDNNCFIKGRTLIRQLSNDSQKLPYRRPTLKSLQEKISEINLMIELSNTNKQYQEIKDELVLEIAEIDMKLEETQEKIATLNKMAEVLINLKSEDEIGRKLARYDFSKLNLTESTSLENVNEEIRVLQENLDYYLYEFEKRAIRLEIFVSTLNMEKDVFVIDKF